MPLTRWIMSSKDAESTPARDAVVNTLYFNVSGSFDEPGYKSLGDDLFTLWAAKPWATGRFLDLRAYDMGDAEPRPQKYIRRQQAAGDKTLGVRQAALCLSYYADRNLPRQRGRLFLGPWTTGNINGTSQQTDAVIGLASDLAGLGGLNVDWSLWSPTNNTATRINHAWVDDSWDIIRSRKLPSIAPRKTWTGNG